MKKEGKNNNFLKILKIIVFFLFVLIILLILVRNISKKQLDDVSPQIPCEQELLKKADIFYVIPKFDNKSISDNREWCDYILSLNKTLGLHGVYHTYEEFLTDRDEEYLQEGIAEFEKCFGKKPGRFKPPQLAISKESKAVIRSKMHLNYYFNELFHKSYHCSDTGRFSNKFIDIF